MSLLKGRKVVEVDGVRFFVQSIPDDLKETCQRNGGKVIEVQTLDGKTAYACLYAYEDVENGRLVTPIDKIGKIEVDNSLIEAIRRTLNGSIKGQG